LPPNVKAQQLGPLGELRTSKSEHATRSGAAPGSALPFVLASDGICPTLAGLHEKIRVNN
jgi:hypothetical protein